MEFLQLVCSEKEYTHDEIATLMGVPVRSLENYRKALFRKFSLRSKTGLVLFVMRLG